jgi:allophanate hydrolase
MTATPTEAVDAAYARIDADGRDGIWISLVPRTDALRAARAVEQRLRDGAELPLAGRTLAVKDNIDVAGMPTTAGCPAYSFRPAVDAPVVAALVAAGAVVVGKTNMDQFATGLVGTRSPYGVCPNAYWSPLVAGGSSSGSAVAVATGTVDLALGTDTAGSGRVPAACNGIVGLKPTRGSISTRGVVPACRSIDCVSVLAASVELAHVATRVAWRTAPDSADPWSRRGAQAAVGTVPWRIGIVAPEQLDVDGDSDGAVRYAQAIDVLAAAGFDVREVDIEPFLAAGALLYGGGFVAERYDAVGAFVDAHRHAVDPVVGSIIAAAGTIPAWQVVRDRTEIERLRAVTAPTWEQIDALVVPSVPRIPTVDEVQAAPIERNARLGTYTNFVNLLDLCALTLPLPAIARPVTLPPYSITFVAPAWNDDRLAAIGARLTPSGTLASPRTP